MQTTSDCTVDDATPLQQDDMSLGLQQVLQSIQRLTGLSSVQDLLRQTLQELQRLFRIRSGCVYQSTEKEAPFRLVHATSLDSFAPTLPDPLPLAGLLGDMFGKQQARYIDANDLASLFDVADQESLQSYEGIALTCVLGPLRTESAAFFLLFEQGPLTNKPAYHLKLGNILLSHCSEVSRVLNALNNLQYSRIRLESILDMAPDGILSINDSMQIIQFNRAAEAMFGYTSQEVLGQSLDMLIPEPFREHHDRHIAQFTRDPRTSKILEERTAITALRKNGEVFPVEISISKQHTGNERIFTAIIREITERLQAEKKLMFQAYYDSLTGLPNRQLFEEQLQGAFARQRRYIGSLLAVLFLDLDRFKFINDSLGHPAGDILLQQVSQRLQQSLRESDTVARWGGDEFVILLEMLQSADDAVLTAQRILHALSQPFTINEQQFLCSGSVGIALCDGKQNKQRECSFDELLRNADIAMYRAKELGRSRYVVFGQSMHAEVQTRMQLENDLRRALEQNKLELFYQPILELKTAQVVGFEALIRWHHPTRGWLSPGVFIPMAEETELIIKLDQWVLQQACLQLQQWHRQYPQSKDITVNINLSAQHFSKPGCISRLLQIIQKTGINPRHLKLEITETTLLKQVDSVTRLLQQLKSHHLHLCMDDFGTGYSSLSYLGRFPIDTLKIDRSFVQQLQINSERVEVIRAIIDLAHSLGMEVIAEGVETPMQMAELEKLTCEYVQGFFISAPVRASIASNFVQDPSWKGEFILSSAEY